MGSAVPWQCFRKIIRKMPALVSWRKKEVISYSCQEIYCNCGLYVNKYKTRTAIVVGNANRRGKLLDPW